MKPFLPFFIFIALFATPQPYAYAFTNVKPITIKVGVSSHREVNKQIQLLTIDKGCEEITDYHFNDTSRVLIEGILVCQALKLGGLNPTFDFISVNNIPRLLVQLNTGVIDILFDSIWHTLAKPENVYISDAVIKEGEFFKGIYTDKKNIKLMKVTSLEQLQHFKAVSSNYWHADWKTLKAMDIDTYSVSKYQFMLKMVHSKRVDFLLDDFTDKEDLSQVYKNIRLVPVPNMKIALKGSRHILVNKHNQHGLEIFTALQKGLKILRKQGRVQQAYQQSGFINERVQDWPVICCLNDAPASN